MAETKADAWVCDGCTHVWLKSGKYPTHCASSKCRSRKWNASAPTPTVETAQAEPVEERRVVYEE